LQGNPISKKLLEKATLQTFTGKWAKSKGYGKPKLYNSNNKLDEIDALGDIVFIFKIDYGTGKIIMHFSFYKRL
jgi:hypothetical protein